MLTEPEPFRPDTDGNQKLVSQGDVIGNILVGDNSFVNSFLHRQFKRFLASLLLDVRKQRHPVLFVAPERGVMVLLERMDKDLSLSLREFTEPDHTLPW